MYIVLRSSYASTVLLFKQKTAYEMRISDWSSDVCSSDLQCAETTRIARGLPMDSPIARQPSVQAFDWMAFIGLPCPKKMAGVLSGIATYTGEIGRASCRDRVCPYV